MDYNNPNDLMEHKMNPNTPHFNELSRLFGQGLHDAMLAYHQTHKDAIIEECSILRSTNPTREA